VANTPPQKKCFKLKNKKWNLYWTRRPLYCTAGPYLAQLCMRSCDVESCAFCTSHCKLSQLSSFQGHGPEWSTPSRFHCRHIWEQMPDNVRKHLSLTLILVSFSCGAPFQYHVYLVLTVIILFRLINHNIRIKTSVCIHHIF
jgi:hypothetical protein